MSRSLRSLFIVTTLLTLAGCASAQSGPRTEPSSQAQASTSAQPMCAMCPMSVQGTQVSASDVEGGAALTFTTATGDVAALRAQVAGMAERHNAHHGMGATSAGGCCQHEGQAGATSSCPQGKDCPGHHGKHEGMGKAMGMGMTRATASVEEVPQGARLVLKPEDPAQVEALREHVHHHAEMMAKGGCGCPAMQGAQGMQPHGG